MEIGLGLRLGLGAREQPAAWAVEGERRDGLVTVRLLELAWLGLGLGGRARSEG